MLEKSDTKKYTAELLRKEEIARDTWAFWFAKPANFSFHAGQSMRMYSPKDKLDGRTLTIASAPHEKTLLFVMRMRGSEFKNTLRSLETGNTIEMEGPYGSRFVLHDDKNVPAVFIAGGIGITPFLSMLSHVTRQGFPYKLTLFYSNKREEDIAFRGELDNLKKENSNFDYVLTLSRESPEDWRGERGRVTKEMIDKYVDPLSKPIFYIAGPPTMVVGMEGTLKKSGVDLNRILTKKFTGYN
jgi:NAD(P)H-flavin reductase